MIRLVTSAILLVGLASAASAVAVSKDSSLVTVNYGDGNGFVAFVPGTDLKPGVEVMVGNGGMAELVYADGCVMKVTPSTVATVVGAVCKPVGGVGGSVGPAAAIAGAAGATTIAAVATQDSNDNAQPVGISR